LIKIIDKIKIGINCENSFKMSKISASNMIWKEVWHFIQWENHISFILYSNNIILLLFLLLNHDTLEKSEVKILTLKYFITLYAINDDLRKPQNASFCLWSLFNWSFSIK
jgi:hypothetical protein